jgi:isopentenyl-diphosphate Delta-isomerase
LIFNQKGDFLIHQRALDKYHSPGLWTNTCCSHPRPGELAIEAAHRRLKEEMGISCQLNKVFSFIYTAEFDNGLVEHEYDNVYVGYYDNDPLLNNLEVNDFRWISREDLTREVKMNPWNYTIWFRLILDKLEKEHNNLLKRKHPTTKRP